MSSHKFPSLHSLLSHNILINFTKFILSDVPVDAPSYYLQLFQHLRIYIVWHLRLSVSDVLGTWNIGSWQSIFLMRIPVAMTNGVHLNKEPWLKFSLCVVAETIQSEIAWTVDEYFSCIWVRACCFFQWPFLIYISQIRTGSNSQCPEIIQVGKEPDVAGIFGANSQGSCDWLGSSWPRCPYGTEP